ncbi:DUF3696 domain-containing protein [Chryseobacterium sp. YIM B08800]|uniref:DUF3696 domain-containing protein n=1 Tax=Chryseobacterium sp. YIM B08800 TaxID=2984136 RepID=UPI00223F5E44|nr:DUF3696 domain-containing protein [Chryseobacterium sp. YIM B08800]
MGIKKIKLKNFKCYKEIELDIAKVTLLTGANSSGKSSLLYSILGSIQSREFPFYFSPNGKYINMGDYTEIVNNHNTNETIEIEFTINEDFNEKVLTQWKIDKLRDLPELYYLEASSDFYNLKIKKVRKYSLDFEYFKDKDPQKEFRSPEILSKVLSNVSNLVNEMMIKQFGKKEKGKDRDEKKRYGSVKEKLNFRFTDLNELKTLIKDDGNYYLDNIVSSITNNFKSYDDNINFISSFRLYPERTYYEASKFDLKVRKFGENYEDQIIAWETTKDERFKKLCEILIELGLLYSIKSKRLSGGRYEILVQIKKNGIWSSITDVGFGISQFLPVIVADLQLKKNSTLFIAQPEIHLHPKVQAQFADYIINRIKNDNKNYIIETHSEYLINRLRLAICEERILEDEISVIYIENEDFETKNYKLELKKDGQIINAPDSFFDTYMLDTMNIVLNAK